MRYTIWITIKIMHTFFHSENSGLELKVTDRTGVYMKKCSLLFRKQNPGQWVILKPEPVSGEPDRVALILKEEETIFDFELIVKNEDFYYFTSRDQKQIQGDGWSLRIPGGKTSGCLCLPITPGAVDEVKDIAISLYSRKVRWEVILIPKYHTDTYPIELKEGQERLVFSPLEPVDFPGEKKAWRSISSTYIPMQETYNYKICLWEKRENGKRLLSNHLPFPKVTSVSIMEPREMITSYFYF